jgi:hypothetical protein
MNLCLKYGLFSSTKSILFSFRKSPQKHTKKYQGVFKKFQQQDPAATTADIINMLCYAVLQ